MELDAWEIESLLCVKVMLSLIWLLILIKNYQIIFLKHSM